MLSHIRLIAFDADDTLWDCQSHFDAVEKQYCELLSDYGSADFVSAELFKTETRNMAQLGYGSKAFTLSLIENAVLLSHGNIKADQLLRIEMLGRSLMQLPATPLPGVEETLKKIRAMSRYKMTVFTKGEIIEQEHKLMRSGLWPLFDRVDVVADKTPRQYRELCMTFGIDISELLMVGNSFKSDIAPVLELGGYAVHIPFEKMWQHEETDEYDHHQLFTLENIRQLEEIL